MLGQIEFANFADEIFVNPIRFRRDFVTAIGAGPQILDQEKPHGIYASQPKDIGGFGIELAGRVGKFDDYALMDKIEKAHMGARLREPGKVGKEIYFQFQNIS
jgi:hypothetical protein